MIPLSNDLSRENGAQHNSTCELCNVSRSGPHGHGNKEGTPRASSQNGALFDLQRAVVEASACVEGVCVGVCAV